MTAEAGECNGRSEGSKVEFEAKGGEDLKDGGIACQDGEEIGGSFVIVNGDSDDHSDRDVDLEVKLDPKFEPGNGGSKSDVEEIGGKEESLGGDGANGGENHSQENGGDVDAKLESGNLVEERSDGDGVKKEEGDLEEENVIGSRSDVKEDEEPDNGAKLDSDAQVVGEEVEADVDRIEVEESEKVDDLESDVRIEHAEEDAVDEDAVDAAEEKQDTEVLAVAEEREAEFVIDDGESNQELGSEVEPEDSKEPATAVLEKSELDPQVGEEQVAVSAVAEAVENGDVESITVEENQEAVDGVGETENVAELEPAIEAEPGQEAHNVVEENEGVTVSDPAFEVEVKHEPYNGIEEIEKVAAVCSPVEVEPNPEPVNEMEVTEKLAEVGSAVEEEPKPEPESGVDETEKLAEVGSSVEFEPIQCIDTVVEEMDSEVKEEDSKVVVEEDDGQTETGSPLNGEAEQEPEPVVEVADAIEAEERNETVDVIAVNSASENLLLENAVAGKSNANGDAPTDQPSGQIENGSTDSTTETSEDYLKDVPNGEARDIPLENSESPCSCHITEKALVEEVSHSTDSKHEELQVSSGDTVPSKTDISSEGVEPHSSSPVKDTEIETRISDEDVETNKAVPTDEVKLESGSGNESAEGSDCMVSSVKDTEIDTRSSDEDVETNKDVPTDEVKLESGSGNESAEGSDCMVSTVEGDRSTNKDTDEEPSHEQAQAAETTQAPAETHVVRRHQVYMIKVPRFINDELQKDIQAAQVEMQKKTEDRDSKGTEARKQAEEVKKYYEDYQAELTKEKNAREKFNAKRKELETVQHAINVINNANSIADIDEKIRNMVHRQQHETISLKEEKQYIHDINQMKRLREQLSSKKSSQEQTDEAFGQKDEIEARFKDFKKEMELLRAALTSAESSTKSAWDKYKAQEKHLKDLKGEHNAAGEVRQEAYLHWRKLREQSSEKDKHFRAYRADQSTATTYIFSGDNQGLLTHCSGQVERIMDLWNNNSEFRQQYVKSNMYSTLKRLGTPDGRSLGPGESAPILRFHVDRSSKPSSVPSSKKEAQPPVLASEVKQGNVNESSATKLAARANQSAISKSSGKPAVVGGGVPVSNGEKTKESNGEKTKEDERERKLKMEQEEQARKADELAREEEELRKERAAKEEELRKERAAAELKERLRLEQRAKAKEAEERKRRKTEKAQAKAEYRAQKEAELKEQKKAKKEGKKSGKADTMSNGSTEAESAPVPETNPPETSLEPETSPGAVSKKRPSRPPSSARQYNKVQAPVPPPLRNRGKRRMRTWMWGLLVVLVVLSLFFAGNYISFSTSSLPSFGL